MAEKVQQVERETFITRQEALKEKMKKKDKKAGKTKKEIEAEEAERERERAEDAKEKAEERVATPPLEYKMAAEYDAFNKKLEERDFEFE